MGITNIKYYYNPIVKTNGCKKYIEVYMTNGIHNMLLKNIYGDDYIEVLSLARCDVMKNNAISKTKYGRFNNIILSFCMVMCLLNKFTLNKYHE